MSDLAVRTDTDLAPLLGPGDPIERAVALAERLNAVVTSRGLAHKYGDNERPFMTLFGWQALGAMVGVSTWLEWTKPLGSNGFEARVLVRRGDQELAAGEGSCSHAEKQFARQSDHSVRAMAQTRATRRALQAALGFVVALGGYDVSNPEAPATRGQVGTLHSLADKLGWSHEQSHATASVVSFNALNREQAGELIDTWSELVTDPGTLSAPVEGAAAEASTTPSVANPLSGGIPGDESIGGASAPPNGVDEAEPPSKADWARALTLYGSRIDVLRAISETLRDGAGVSTGSVTAGELAAVIKAKEATRGP